MKSVLRALALAGVALPLLAGCGSSTPPPLTLACKSTRLAWGGTQARVTLTNTTSKIRTVYIYGPVFASVRHVFPFRLLFPTTVSVSVPNAGTNTYVAFMVPRVAPKKPAHLILRFAPPPRPQSIQVASSRNVRAPNWNILNNPDCIIRKLR